MAKDRQVPQPAGEKAGGEVKQGHGDEDGREAEQQIKPELAHQHDENGFDDHKAGDDVEQDAEDHQTDAGIAAGLHDVVGGGRSRRPDRVQAGGDGAVARLVAEADGQVAPPPTVLAIEVQMTPATLSAVWLRLLTATVWKSPQVKANHRPGPCARAARQIPSPRLSPGQR